MGAHPCEWLNANNCRSFTFALAKRLLCDDGNGTRLDGDLSNTNSAKFAIAENRIHEVPPDGIEAAKDASKKVLDKNNRKMVMIVKKRRFWVLPPADVGVRKSWPFFVRLGFP